MFEATFLTPVSRGGGSASCPAGTTGCGCLNQTSCCNGNQACQAAFNGCNYCVTVGCFPASATVRTESGLLKAMSEVRIGDRLLMARADGSLGYEDVYLNTHRDAVVATSYIVLTLASGRSLSLSPLHFIPIATTADQPWGARVTVGADEVREGDQVRSQGAGGQPVRDSVVAVAAEVAVGAYNPLTMNGTIVVDGVVASAHSDWFLDGIVSADAEAKVYQAILAPVRLAYRVLGPDRMATVTEEWGVVDAVREATTPGAPGRSAAWAAGVVATLIALAAARRRALDSRRAGD